MQQRSAPIVPFTYLCIKKYVEQKCRIFNRAIARDFGDTLAIIDVHGSLSLCLGVLICTLGPGISPSLAPGQVIKADLCSKGEVWPIPKADWSSPSGACRGDLRCFGSLKPPRNTCADLGDDRPPDMTLQKHTKHRER